MVTVRPRPSRLGAAARRFPDLGPQPVEQAQLLQKLLVMLDAERQRHLGRADIGGVA